MKSKYNIIIAFFSIISFSFSGLNDNGMQNNTLIERIYLHTDKPLYFPGETIWFKAYAMASNNQITQISDVLYVDLISPKGETVKTLKLRIAGGSAYGDFRIDESMPGGMYVVKAYTKWMKNFGENIYFYRKLKVQKIVKPKLLIKLDFEKETYGKSSKVIANFELKNLKNEALINKEIEYILNISGKKYLSEQILTNSAGKADIKFSLPDSLNTSNLLLNVLIPHNGNVESISRTVPVILDNIDLQFFAEGGYLIQNKNNTLAFKALNEFGKPADFEAQIIDNEGNVLTQIESFHDGMGAFEFTPEKNKKYYAKIVKPFVSNLKYELPISKESGFLLSLVKNDSLEIVFNVYASELSKVRLVAKSASKSLIEKKMVLQKGWNEVGFSANDFPIGIVEFTLFNESDEPQVERLVFANKTKDLKISIKTDKKQYAPREKVNIEITTTNSKGEAIPANLSIAVADDKILSFADDKQDNILSYLLLSSYLKGKINKPNFYFDPEEEKASKAIDLVMLTHGWRSYFYNDKINILDAKFKAEQVDIVARTVVDKNHRPIKATVLILESRNGRKLAKIKTDETGYFAFKKEVYKNYVAVAYTKDNQQVSIVKNFKPIKKQQEEKTGENSNKTIVEKNKENINNTDEKEKETPENNIEEENIKQKINKGKTDKKIEVNNKTISKKQKTASTKANGVFTLQNEDVAIEECIVTGYGISREKKSLAYTVSSVDVDELNANNVIEGLQGRVAGLQVNVANTSGSSQILLRGSRSISSNNKVLIIIDGLIASEAIFDNLNVSDIKSVNVLKGNVATVLYGTSAANGVIIITTKNTHFYGSKSIKSRKIKNFAFDFAYYNGNRNYYLGRKFYVPVYDTEYNENIRIDFRQTIYWNPIVQTDENGKANLSFYNSDAITSFKIIGEGIGYNGLTGRQEQSYGIQKPLSIDVKIPAYLTVGDTLEIPLIVSNNTDNELNTAISISLPKELKLIGEIANKLTIAKNSGKTQTVKIVPVKEYSGTNILIGVKTKEFEDLFTKKVDILSPLFPKNLSFSGNSNETFNFSLNDKIDDGILQANFTVYVDIVGDVMNGIESILREPHGCFEQVSATAYPNVMVMKYLKESGKLKPDIKRKAMKYIANGYRKLAAYETKDGGFEWYGATPPHEVLSAYGIMQFTEMKDVFAGVDNRMIERTVDWLMSRKNGQGGFLQNRGKYGFSAGPVKVNNAYIVYALSESGIDANIEKEYEMAFNEALISEDYYRLALMASASYNFKKIENYNKIINILIEKTDWNDLSNLKAENSITYSYGNSLKVETASLIALAFMKTDKNIVYVQKCINFILKNRRYNRFGNTQATSLALKVLIEFTKLKKNDFLMANGNSISIIVNGKEIETMLEQNEDGLIFISGIEKYLTTGKQKFEVRFSNDKISLPYSLNINWKTSLPETAELCPLNFKTKLVQNNARLGEIVRMNIKLENKLNKGVPMSVAIVGIPSGLSVQMWQLEELKEKNKFAYYEIMKNYVIFYWRELGPNKTKTIFLDLKTEVKGVYSASASSAYLYYSDENKKWIKGTKINVR